MAAINQPVHKLYKNGEQINDKIIMKGYFNPLRLFGGMEIMPKGLSRGPGFNFSKNESQYYINDSGVSGGTGFIAQLFN